jgi:hypothetical protein
MTSRTRWLVTRRTLRLLAVGWALVGLPPAARATDADRASPAEQAPTEVNERVSDPVSPTWSLKLKNTMIGKVVKLARNLPIKLELQAQYVPVHPDPGERFIVQLSIIPIVPAPIPEL